MLSVHVMGGLAVWYAACKSRGMLRQLPPRITRYAQLSCES